MDNIAELIASADIFIGAGGTETWGRASEGLPNIVTSSSGTLPNIPDKMFINDSDLLNPLNYENYRVSAGKNRLN